METIGSEEGDLAVQDGDDDVQGAVPVAGDEGPQPSSLDPFGAGMEAALADEPEDSDKDYGIRQFDFNRPHSISRNFEQQLCNLGENFAKAASITFTNIFRVNTVLEFRKLRLLTCGDYLGQMGHPTFVATVTLAPLKGQALLHLDLALCFTMLKKLMGGLAEADEVLREFTEIERGIFHNLVLKILGILGEASTRLVDLKPELLSIENNAEYIRGFAVGDSLLVMTFGFKLDAVEGSLEFGIPMPAFEPVRSLFDPEEMPELRSPTEQQHDRQLIMDLVQGTHSEVVVKLGELDANLEAIMQLEVGDILHLSQPVDAPLVVEVQDKPMFLGEPGRIRQNRAVKLIERTNEE